VQLPAPPPAPAPVSVKEPEPKPAPVAAEPNKLAEPATKAEAHKVDHTKIDIDALLGTASNPGAPTKVEPEHKPEPKAAPVAATPSIKPDAPAPKAEEQPLPPGVTLVTIPDNPRFPTASLKLARVEKHPDGSLRIDNRFKVTGSGTPADPYKVPWDMLTSAKETYNPRLGLTKLPQRVVMFDGQHIKLTGFSAFPIAATTPKDMLIMLNQWDGCCIGTPPTAYDAVECHLAKAGTAEDRAATHGSVKGVFKLDPYEDNGWLLGLYMIDGASFTADD
jgi:hypothetical protein